MLSLKSFAVAAMLLTCAGWLTAYAQQPAATSSSSTSSSSSNSFTSPLPDAPSERRVISSSVGKAPAPPPHDGAFASLFRANASCGAGATVQAGAPQNAVAMCGLGFTFVPGVAVEVGGIGPQGGWPRFYISADGYLPLAPVSHHLARRLHGEPIALVGYTKMFYNSNDLDVGLGWDHHIDDASSVVYELRDYVQFSSPAQHTLMLRVNFVTIGAD